MSGKLLCLYLPSFRVAVAAAAAGCNPTQPLALAGTGGRLGEVSPAAAQAGAREGMRFEEALLRCPGLRLLSPDPAGCRELWERVLAAVEGVGGAVEAPMEGVCHLAVAPLLGLYASPAGVAAAVREAVAPLLAPAAYRLGVGPSRFYALLAAHLAAAGGVGVVDPNSPLLERLGVWALELHPSCRGVAAELAELGLRTLAAVRAVGGAALAERFGRHGELIQALLAGEERPLQPRPAPEAVEARLELEPPYSEAALARALEVLLERLRSHPRWRGRTVSLLALSAALAGGGSWQRRVVLREPTNSKRLLLDRCRRCLAELPAAPLALSLRVERFGPVAPRQPKLSGRGGRPDALGQAIAQLQAAVGEEALLRVVTVEEQARAPERRFMVAPPEGER